MVSGLEVTFASRGMLFLYNIFIRAYTGVVGIAAVSNKKAREWISGRKGAFEKLEQKINASDKIIWFHCSSAGEFEQGLPLMEALAEFYPSHKLLVTFFSPSGMKAASKYQDRYILSFLPVDTRAHATRFIELAHPELVIFVKYEFWYHYVAETAFRHIPLLLISAVFRKEQLFFKPYGRFYRQMLFLFRHIFVQDPNSLDILRGNGISHCSVSGDTRFDRVQSIAARSIKIDAAEKFAGAGPVVVAGSTWPDDENILAAAFKAAGNLKLIIAPHETNEGHIAAIEKQFHSTIRYSALSNGNNDAGLTAANVLIIDSVGLLSRLYRYATITYVGGGFTKDGIHNILEAAVYRKPVLFGPNYKKYREATELLVAGGAFSVCDEAELKKVAEDLLYNTEALEKAGVAAGKYISENTGAAAKLIQFIQEKRLLTS